jgi:hypothetical protein
MRELLEGYLRLSRLETRAQCLELMLRFNPN